MTRRCKNGHDLSDPASRYGRNCRICHGARMRQSARDRATGSAAHRQPSKVEIVSSHAAIAAIFALDERLARNDYLNVVEADEIRRQITTMSQKVVV